MKTGLVFNLQKYSLHDGPGIRTTVFLKGCPLQCAWCHNPESISPQKQLILLESRCIACGECRRVCPFGTISAQNVFQPTGMVCCTLCGACANACPAAAREIVGRNYTPDELMPLLLQDRVFYEESGGGVTFSGGEPLLQHEFLFEMLTACRSERLHTAVDTSGMCPTSQLLRIAPLADLFLFDIKFIDPLRHRRFAGASNELILENLKALGAIHANIWVRIPIIPGVNDANDDFEAAAAFASSIAGVRQVNLLPYHRTGTLKFERLGQDISLKRIKPPSAERLTTAMHVFERNGLKTVAGG